MIAVILTNLINVLTLVVVADTLLSYFLDPYHPVRRTLDQLVEPFLRPIKRLMPNTGMVDFSPLILILILQLIGQIVVKFLV